MTKGKPNILYIFADQLRRQAVGYANEDPVKTPKIDEFSREGVVFNQAVTVSPLCSPHRASLLTGKYPISTGVYTNCKIGADIMLGADEISVGDVLKEGGYRTGYIGKWHLDLPELNVTDAPESGAKNWDAYTPPGPRRQGFDYWYSYGAWDKHMRPHYWQDTPQKIQVNQWSVEHETNKAIDFIQKDDQKDPFALFVSWNPPHSPFDQVPEKYKEMFADFPREFRENVTTDSYTVHTGEEVEGGRDELYEKQKNYYAAIAGLDENFGRILACLKENDLEENTIVVFTSDHGEMMGSHGIMAKHVWYEESIGVPFCVRWPKNLQAQTSETLLNTVDIMPTLLGLADLEIPTTVEGRDLSNVIKGENKDEPEVSFMCGYPGRKVAIEAFKEAGENNLEAGWRAARTRRYTYVIHKGYEPGEPVIKLLYNLEEDPYQMHPEEIGDPSKHDIAQQLNAALIVWLKELNDPFVFSLT